MIIEKKHSLNYTFCNEDTAIEYNALEENSPHVFAYAGSGSRVLPLFAKNPKNVTCVDLSEAQLALTELKIESIRNFSYEVYMNFWGIGNKHLNKKDRESLFSQLELNSNTKDFLLKYFNNIEFESLLFTGRWEKTFKLVHKVLSLFVGDASKQLFATRNLQEQIEIFKTKFPQKAYYTAIYIIINASFFKAFLKRKTFDHVKLRDTLFTVYKQKFDRLFLSSLARENFFLQYLFFGRILYPEGLPFEFQESNFTAIKNGIKNAKIAYVAGDFLNVLSEMASKVSFVSISDLPSSYAGELNRTYMQIILPCISTGAKVVCRYYIHKPELVYTGGYINISERFAKIIRAEKTQLYQIDIYQKI